MTSPAYQVLWDIEHLLTTDDREDIVLERAEQYKRLPSFWPVDLELPAGLSDPIIFAANFGHVNYTNYPVNDRRWPIMSRQMLETLLSVGDFPHRAIPIAIIDPIGYRADPAPGPDFVEERLKRANHDFVIVQLTEHLDILDEESSDIRRSRALPGLVTITEYALNVPEQGLPPLFRLSIQPMQLFISAEGRKALADAQLAGPHYLPLEGYVNGEGEEVDVPVPEPELPEGA